MSREELSNVQTGFPIDIIKDYNEFQTFTSRIIELNLSIFNIK